MELLTVSGTRLDSRGYRLDSRGSLTHLLFTLLLHAETISKAVQDTWEDGVLQNHI